MPRLLHAFQLCGFLAALYRPELDVSVYQLYIEGMLSIVQCKADELNFAGKSVKVEGSVFDRAVGILILYFALVFYCCYKGKRTCSLIQQV